MSARPPGAGRRVATGHVRVDAKRAIAKLREYQLADRTTWVLEAIRAAVAAGAESISVRGDSNDVWVEWAGEPLGPETLPSLLDELVSPQARSGQERRLLATAINSSLGLEPAHVDVIAIDADGNATRARYTPQLFEQDAKDTSLDLGVRAEATEAPSGAPCPGMHIHLRRRLNVDTLHYLFAGPPELTLARDRCLDIGVPISVNGNPVSAAPELADLLRHELPGGFIALLGAENPRARPGAIIVDVAERGVVLTSYSLVLDSLVSLAPLPVRLFIDADRLPTNASRSEVRRDAHPIATIERDAEQALASLIDTLVERLAAAPSETLAVSDPLRAAALALLASQCAGKTWTRTPHPAMFEALADLPLLEDAVGMRKPVSNRWREVAYRGKSAYPEELEPWLSDILWLHPDDPAACLFGDSLPDGRAAKKLARAARKQLRAKKKFLAHRQREAAFSAEHRCQARAPIGTFKPESRVERLLHAATARGFGGEVCVHHERGLGRFIILLHGREIEELEVDSPIAFEAIVDSVSLEPASGYRGVIRNQAFLELEQAVYAQVVAILEAQLADELPAGFQIEPTHYSSGALADLIRRATAFAWQHGITHAGRSPFDEQPAWPDIGGRQLSLQDLRRFKVIGTTVSAEPIASLSDRPVVCATTVEHWQLASMLKPQTDVIRYDIGAASKQPPAERMKRALIHTSTLAILPCEGSRLRGAIAWGSGVSSELVIHHVGRRLVTERYAAQLRPSSIWVEADAAVPDSEWSPSSDLGGADSFVYSSWEQRMARAVAQAVCGEPPEELDCDQRDSPQALVELLIPIAEEHDLTEILGEELKARLEHAAIFDTIEGEDVSAADLAARFAKRIPFVSAPGTDVPRGWPALWASESRARFVATLAGRAYYEASEKLETRRRRARRERNLERHRLKPENAITAPPLSAPIEAGNDVSGFVSLGFLSSGIELELHLEWRLFTRHVLPSTLPLSAIINGPESLADSELEGISKAGKRQIVEACEKAAGALLLELGRADAAALSRPGKERTLLRAWLDSVSGQANNRARNSLRKLAMFETVNGGLASIADATSGATRIASYRGEWLEPDGGKPDELDQPVLRIEGDDTEVRELIFDLAPIDTLDVSEGVRTLQLSRRMARGILPKPTVSVPAELKRTFKALGEKKRGPGEIGLVAGPQSKVVLHEAGEPGATLRFDITPAVDAAFEAPDLVARFNKGSLETGELKAFVAGLALRLLEKVASTVPLEGYPMWLQTEVARGLLAGELVTNSIAELPLFPTTGGEWLTYTQICDQAVKFGEVWYTSAGSRLEPLDEARVALALPREAIPQHFSELLKFVRADAELELDAKARRNRDRTPVTELVLSPGEKMSVLGVHTYAENAAVKGEVAPLTPESAGLRGVHVYRRGVYLGHMPDPCPWPTVAIVDDRTLTPDRTWSKPVEDARWKRLTRDVRAASKEVINETFSKPASGSLTTRRVNESIGEYEVRGRLWLHGTPEPSGIRIETSLGVGILAPTITVGPGEYAVPLGGTMMLYPRPREVPTATLLPRILSLYGQLLSQALRRWNVADKDQIAAHLAVGLALKCIKPADTKRAVFSCVEGDSEPARALAAMITEHRPVVIVDDENEAYEPAAGELLLRNDESVLFSAIRQLAAERPEPSVEVHDIETLDPIEEPPIRPPPKKPAEKAPFEPLRLALTARLSELGILLPMPVKIASGRSPIVSHVDGALAIASKHPVIESLNRELASRTRAKKKPVDQALDALALHCITVLNVSWSAVTASNEKRALSNAAKRAR